MNRNSNNRNQTNRHTRYMPGLDGLRAIAVIGIIIYHLNKQWLSGGFLGVDTFFVISGYLITSLLLFEYESTGIINLKQFWLRRIKRLIPAVLVLVVTVTLATLIFKPEQIISIKHDAFAAIFYVSNWWYIATDVNYFEQFAFMPLKHLWSLAIEEQFYIVFPIVLIALLLTIKKYRNVTLIFWIKLKQNPNPSLRFIIDSIGAIGILILLLLFIKVDDNSDWIYNGGFYLISGITLFVIISVVHPSGYFAKLIGNPFFVYIGKRSYSLYLWHFPVISFLHSYYVEGQVPLYVYALDILLTIFFAEISYRFIETQFRKQGFKALSINKYKKSTLIRTILLGVILLPTIFIFAGTFDRLGKGQINNKSTSYNTAEIDKYMVRPIPVDDVNFLGDSNFKKDKDNEVYTDLSPLLIGDSVMVDIGETFKTHVPNATIDGKVGRNLYEAIPLTDEKYKSYNYKSKQVILELGTNGDFSEAQLDELIGKYGKANVYLINTRVPRSYEGHVNQVMSDAAKKHHNVTLIDWYQRSKGHSEYFAPDGIHLEPSGVKALTDEILKHIATKSTAK